MARREVDEWFWQLGADLQKLGEELTRQRPLLASSSRWEPKVDLVEEDDRFVLKAELAGIRGDEIDLTYVPERHAIQLRGMRPEESGSEGSKIGVYQLEILYGEFEREVKLPDVSVDPSGIKAQYRNGFLLVMIPKKERTSNSKPKHIPIAKAQIEDL